VTQIAHTRNQATEHSEMVVLPSIVSSASVVVCVNVTRVSAGHTHLTVCSIGSNMCC